MLFSLKIMRVTANPTQVKVAATVDLRQGAAVMWSFMSDPASGTQLDAEVEAGFTLPGSPSGLGEVQVFLRRTPGGRVIAALEVIEFEPDRRAVTRSLDVRYPIYGILTVEPLGSDSCRLTQEYRFDLPAGTPVANVRRIRDHLRGTAQTEMTRLAELAPRLSAGGVGDDQPTGAAAAVPADGPPDPKTAASLRIRTEVVDRHRRAYLGGAALAILTTGLTVAVIAVNSGGFLSYPQAEIASLWIVAAAMVCAGAVLAGVIRLLSAATAASTRWLRRYSAGVTLLAPAALILTGRFSAGSDMNDCGTLLDQHHLLDRNDWPAPTADFRRACGAAAQSRLHDVIVWAVAGSLAAVVYGLQLRRRRRRPAR